MVAIGAHIIVFAPLHCRSVDRHGIAGKVVGLLGVSRDARRLGYGEATHVRQDGGSADERRGFQLGCTVETELECCEYAPSTRDQSFRSGRSARWSGACIRSVKLWPGHRELAYGHGTTRRSGSGAGLGRSRHKHENELKTGDRSRKPRLPTTALRAHLAISKSRTPPGLPGEKEVANPHGVDRRVAGVFQCARQMGPRLRLRSWRRRWRRGWGATATRRSVCWRGDEEKGGS